MSDPRIYVDEAEEDVRPLPVLRQSLAVRRERAMELRIGGASYRAIGQALGVSHTTAENYIHAMLTETAEATDTLRRMEVRRLDRLWMAHWPAATKGDYKALEAVLTIMRLRWKLLGLEAPRKIDITGYVRAVAIEEGWDPEVAVSFVDGYVRSLPT